MSSVWDQAATEFEHWSGRLWRPLAEPLVEAAQLKRGDRVFDACCGTGASALLAAAAVGPGGQVDAVDLSPRMIDQARKDQSPTSSAQVNFELGDALGWAGSVADYDAVLCGFGIFFLGDQDSAFDALARRLAPGGRIAMSLWQGRPFEPLAGMVLAACAAEGGGIAEPSPEIRNIGRLNSEPKLSAFLTSASSRSGLRDFRVRQVTHRVELTTETAWSFVRSSLLLAALPAGPAAVERVRRRLGDTLDGVRLEADALIGSARK